MSYHNPDNADLIIYKIGVASFGKGLVRAYEHMSEIEGQDALNLIVKSFSESYGKFDLPGIVSGVRGSKRGGSARELPDHE